MGLAFLLLLTVVVFFSFTIVQRKKVERRFSTSEEKFRHLFHHHAAVKLLIDPDTGNIVEANEAAERFYGWPLTELCRMRVQDINMLSAQAVRAEMERARSLERTHFE